MSAGGPDQLFAVVVNWNGGEQNLECLASLLAEGLLPERIVFVDNGSGDGSLEAVRARWPDLRVIANGANLGFGEAANRGAELALSAGAQSVLYVNNDLVLEPGALEGMRAALWRHPRVGVVGPRVLQRERPGRLWAAGGRITWRTNLSRLRGHGRADGPAWRREEAVDYVPGCAMLVRRGVLEAIGGLAADYFAYMEDVDFCLRASQAGFGILYLGQAAAQHASSSATGGGYNPRRKYMNALNSVRFLRAHGKPARWISFLLCDVFTLPFAFAAAVLRGRGRALLAKGLGLWDGFRGRRVTAERLRPGSSRLW